MLTDECNGGRSLLLFLNVSDVLNAAQHGVPHKHPVCARSKTASGNFQKPRCLWPVKVEAVEEGGAKGWRGTIHPTQEIYWGD